MQVNNYDYSMLILFNPTSDTGNVTNSSGSTETLKLGTLIGRVAATGLLVAQVSTATDGSQVPIGVLAATYTIANGATQSVIYIKAGELNSGMIIYGGSDTSATSITDNSTHLGTIGDILSGKGILLKPGQELTYVDTQ